MANYRPPTGDQKTKKDTEEKPSDISWRIDAWFPDLGPEKRMLRNFAVELINFNKSLNLISAGTLPSMDLIHFADSVMASQIIHKQIGDKEVYDIGSGNGFPGIVYSILFPKSKVVLVEVDSRKADFLRTMSQRLNLTNLQVMQRSFESIPPESIEFAMARGFAAIPKALLLARKVLKLKGTFYHIKGTEWALEIAEMPTQLCSFWTSGLVSEYSWPAGESKYFVVSSQKTKV